MRRMGLSVVAIATLVALGCGGREQGARAQQQPPTSGAEQACPCPGMQGGGEGMAAMCPGMGMHGGDMAMDCPMCAPPPDGATVRSEPIAGGVALTFTAANDEDVEALRARVRDMADAHTRHHEAGAAEGGAGRMSMMRMPPSAARAVDVERGARLELRAIDEEDVTPLRAHVERMRACPMMAGQTPTEERPPAG